MIKGQEKPPSSVLLPLPGSCGHTIDVRVRVDAADSKAVAAATEAGRPYAKLVRLCPICMVERTFRLPLGSGLEKPQLQPSREPVLRQEAGLKLRSAFEVIPPIERAYRLWEGSREHDFDRAETMLRNAADLFDRRGRFMERRGVIEELARRLAAQGEDEKAEEFRHQIERGLI